MWLPKATDNERQKPAKKNQEELLRFGFHINLLLIAILRASRCFLA